MNLVRDDADADDQGRFFVQLMTRSNSPLRCSAHVAFPTKSRPSSTSDGSELLMIMIEYILNGHKHRLKKNAH